MTNQTTEEGRGKMAHWGDCHKCGERTALYVCEKCERSLCEECFTEGSAENSKCFCHRANICRSCLNDYYNAPESQISEHGGKGY